MGNKNFRPEKTNVEKVKIEEAIEEFVQMLESTLNRLNELTPRIKDNENYEEYFKRIYGDKYV